MKIRSFLAFDIDPKVRAKLGALISDFQKKGKGVKWTEPDKLHVTLKFFGDVEEDVLRNIHERLKDGLVDEHVQKLFCQGIGVFPNWKYPRVIWAGFGGDVDPVIELQGRIEKLLHGFPIEKDKRAFRLHLTIGRAKEISSASGLIHLVEGLGPIEFGEVVVDRVTIYKSVLTKEGPVYTPLYTIEFKK